MAVCLLGLLGQSESTFAGHIIAWGNNGYGQCDVPEGSDFVAIAAGGGVIGGHNLALKSDGLIVAWGWNYYGQCDVPEGNDFIAIAAGADYSLALKSDGSLVAWGRNYYGQCDVPEGNDFATIACGNNHGLALRSDGSIAAWGRNDYGQCNVSSGTGFIAISGGLFHSVAIKSDSSLRAWGYDWWRPPIGYGFVAIDSASHTNIALKSDGLLVAWGDNSEGQCNVSGVRDFIAVASGSYHNLALKSNGSLRAWGYNGYGQCDVPKGKDFVAIGGGSYHSIALSTKLPEIYRVDADANGANDGSSWADAFNYLQDALAVAQYSDEIWVAQGTYKPDQGGGNSAGDRGAAFELITGVAIRGGYAGFSEPDPNARNIGVYKTILSGDLNGDDGANFINNSENSYHVVRCHRVFDTAILDGFTITAGNANGSDGSREGGGIYCVKGGPTIINCAIVGNSAEGTYSFGGGIYNDGSSPILLNCLISSNSAGRSGGGMYNNNHSRPILTNCTTVANSAGVGGSGLAGLNYSHPRLTNCILWNGESQIWNGSNSTITITYSNIKDGWPGEGNIDDDPCFVESGYWADANDPNIIVEPDEPNAVWIDGDYHLLPYSACIDAGDPAYIPEPNETDLDGNPRVIGDAIDMGAYEYRQYLIVDDMDSYYGIASHEIHETWKDYRVNSTGAEVYVWQGVSGPEFVRDGNSMRFYYKSSAKKINNKYCGSKAEADTTDLECGSDWTAGGVKSLSLWFYGDSGNVHDGQDPCEVDQMYVALETTPGSWVVSEYPGDMCDVKEEEWHEWNINLQDFNDGGVTLSNVTKMYIGFGGYYEIGQSSKGAGYPSSVGDTVYFDDIRVYPPRCFVEYTHASDFTEDCITDYADFDIMADEWLISDYEGAPQPPAAPIIEYLFDEGTGSTTTANTGSYGSSYDLTIGLYLDANGNSFIHPNHAPLWVNDPCRGTCLWFDGEAGQWPKAATKEDAMLGGDYLVMPALNLQTDTFSITAWIKPNPTFGKTADEFKDGFTGIVTTRKHPSINPSVGTQAAGLHFGAGGSFVYNGMLGYTWNDAHHTTWNWDPDIFPVNLEWNFVAVTIAPDQATIYDVNESAGALEIAANVILHSSELLDAKWIIAGNIDHFRFFKGHMDDIRIYDHTLSTGEIMNLAGVAGTVYIPNKSVANVFPKLPPPTSFDPDNPDIVNFLDYRIMADNWLREILWPPEP